MIKRGRNGKRILALALAVMMTVSEIPTTAFAEEIETVEEISTNDQVVEEPDVNISELEVTEPDDSTEEPISEEKDKSGDSQIDKSQQDTQKADTTLETQSDDSTVEEEPVTDEIESYADSDFTIVDNVLTEYLGTGGNVDIPDGVTAIGANAFKDDSSVESITFPDSLIRIGSYAFSGCTGLTGSLVIPDSVQAIDFYAFSGCTGLTEVTFGEGLLKMSSRAFYGCSKVETVFFKGIETPVIYEVSLSGISKGNNYASVLFGSSGMSGVTDIWVSEGCYSTYVSAFGGYIQDKTRFRVQSSEDCIIENGVLIAYVGDEEQLILPEQVEEIGERAFQNNQTLKEVVFPKTLKKIGNYAFSGCVSLEGIAFPESLEEIGNYAFSKCISFSGNLNLPDSLKKIGNYAFYEGKGFIGELVLPKNLEEIGKNAFCRCTGFEGNLILPEGLVKIGNDAFNGCSGLTGNLILPDSIASVGSYAFNGCSGFTGNLVLSRNMTAISDYAFSGCKFTGNLEIPEGVTSIGNYAFSGCGFEGSLVLPVSVELLDGYAFNNCVALTEVTFGENFSEIASHAFWNCSGITRIIFKKNINPVIRYETLDGSSSASNASTLFGAASMKNLKEIQVPPGYYGTYAARYGSFLQNGTRIKETGAEDFIIEEGILKAYVGDSAEVIIPDGITEIGATAFQNIETLVKVVFPMGLKKIGNSAFKGCTNLSVPELPKELEEIGDYAFDGCTSLNGTLLLPDSLTKIGAYAFRDRSGLEINAVLPKNLTEIGNYAFYRCTGLKGKLELPEGITKIGMDVFSGCTGLNGDLVLPNSLTSLGSYAFSGCSGLTGTLTLSESLTGIGNSAFSSCKFTGELNIPGSVKSIGTYAFSGCAFSGSLNFPDSVESINSRAFSGCTGLTEVIFGQNFNKISKYAFWGASGIEKVVFTGTTTPEIYEDNINNTSASNSYAESLFGPSNMSNLKEIWVPEGCYNIYAGAFSTYLQSKTRIKETGAEAFIIKDNVLIAYTGDEVEVVIPDEVTEIGTGAFQNHQALKSVELPSGIKKIGTNAFRNCVGLTGIELPKGLEEIGDYAFYGCNGLTGNLVLPDSLIRIGARAFYERKELLIDVELPQNLQEIGDYAFYKCEGLKGELVLPESLTKIGREAFSNCTGLTEKLVLPDSITSLGTDAFLGCSGLTGTLALSQGLASISSGAFSGCKFTGKLKIPESIKAIGSYAFRGCAFEESLLLPDSLESISTYAFSGCTGLKEVVFGQAIGKLNQYAFSGCSGIERIIFTGNQIPGIYESGISGFPTMSCASYLFGSSSMQNLKEMWVPEGCYTAYSGAYGAYLQSKTRIKETGSTDFIINDGVLIAYVGDEAQVIIPDEVTEIAASAFKNNKTLASVVFPIKLKKIGDYAFDGCISLSDLELPEGLEEIGSYAFRNCGSQEVKLELPDSLKKIGAYAFCDRATWAMDGEFPKSLTEIGNYAFANCKGLKGESILPEGLTKIGTNVFSGCTGLTGNLVLPNSLTSLGSDAFSGCSGLTGTLTLSQGLKGINSGAFSRCKFTGELKIPESVKSIGTYAFTGCAFEGILLLPDSLESISTYAFSGCTGLTEVTFGQGIAALNKEAFYNCSGVQSVIFTGSKVPAIYDNGVSSSYSNRYASTLFGSSCMKNLKTIYTLPDYLDTYKSAWESYIPSTVTFSTDTLSLPVFNLKIDYIYSHSAKLSWNPAVNEKVIGYYVYRDGEKIADVKESSYVDTNLEMDTTYDYDITGYVESGAETAKASLTVATAKPTVLKIYTDNIQDKVGVSNGNLYASVKYTGDYVTVNDKTAIGVFYYYDKDNHKIRIGEAEAFKKSASELVYKANWDIDGIVPDTYEVGFEMTDPDGETGTLSKPIIVDSSRPEPISSVMAIGDVNKIALSWTIAHEIDTNQYHIYRRREDQDDYTLIKKVYDRKTLSYIDTKAVENMKYYYYVTAVNDFGQESLPSEVTVAIPETDTEPPRVVQLTPVNGSIIGGKVELYAQAKDNIAVVKTELYQSIDEKQTWTLLQSDEKNYCRYSLDTKQYEDTKLWIKAVAYDAAGNVSKEFIYGYKIDNTGPEQVQGISYESTSTTITLKWKDVVDRDLAFFRVEQQLEDGTFKKVQDISTTLGVNLYNLNADTEYYYRVVAYDRLGNRGTESDIILTKTLKDGVAPVITSIQPGADYYNKEIALKITATDDTSIAKVVVQTSKNTILWDDFKTFAFDGTKKAETVEEILDLAEMEEGAIYVRAIATDKEGNEGDSSGSAPYTQYIVDKTAPKSPSNLKINAIAGALELTWDMGEEEDIDDYIVYRSEDGATYNKVKSGLYSVNYWDRNIEKSGEYWYKIAVRDKAGNISDLTEAVKAELAEDTEAPEIRSFGPSANSMVGPSEDTFSVMVSDNWKLNQILVTYRINEETLEHELINSKNIDDYYKLASAKLPIAGLKDGDEIHLQVMAKDIQGLETVSDKISYTVDKTAPKVNQVSATGDNEKIVINWTGNGEKDLAGYRVYRRTEAGQYSMIAQRSAVSDVNYQYEDYNGVEKKTYYYKIEAIDKTGNASFKESESTWLTVQPKLEASFNCDLVQEVNVEYEFDASVSVSDVAISSYEFDFGDGTSPISGTGTKVIHRYTTTGTYQVSLTITDENGAKSVIEKMITVEEPKLLGTVKVKVVDGNGAKVVGAPVYFDLDRTSENVKYTDSTGYTIFSAGAGQYAIGAYQDGYLPVKKSIVVSANTTKEYELTMIEQPIVTGQFEVNRMTLDEIIAAGIDVNKPENQHVVEMSIKITYGSHPVSMNMVTNGNQIFSGGTKVVNTSEGRRKLSASVLKLPAIAGNNPDNTVIAIIDVPVEASFLKEFFDVKLHIINHADSEFVLEHNRVTLEVPEGMSLIPALNSKHSASVDFDSLRGQEEKTIQWVLRGDDAGEYDLKANYNGVLAEFNAPVSAEFKTDSPIKVYGKNAIQLVATLNTKISNGAFYFDLSMRNKGGADIYLPTFNVVDHIIDVYEKKDEEEKGTSSDSSELPPGEIGPKDVELLSTVLQNQSGHTQTLKEDEKINVLSVGESYTKKFVSYNAVTTDDILYLKDAIAQGAEEMGVEVVIEEVDMDLYSVDNAEEKVESILQDKTKQNMYRYVLDADLVQGIGDSNFYYYMQAIDDDQNYFKKLGEALYRSTDCVLRLNMDLFTNDSMENITRNCIYDMLQDVSFQSAVDAKIDATYLTTARSLIGSIKDAMPKGSDNLMGNIVVWETVGNVLSETNNVKSLASTLKIEGINEFWNRVVKIVGITAGSAAMEVMKQKIQKSDVACWFGESMRSELGSCSQIISAVSTVTTAWNESVEFTNKMVVINAAHEEALQLTDMVLKHPEINQLVYNEVKRIRNGLVSGFTSQTNKFIEEFLKLQAITEGRVIISKALKLIDNHYNYVNGAGVVMAALTVAFGVLDYTFDWKESVSELQRLRVAAALTIPFRREAANLRAGENSAYSLSALKYLIKMRIIGEKTYVDIAKKNGEEKALAAVNQDMGGAYASLEDYYMAFRERILSYRDSLFSEIPMVHGRPKAPEVTIDYRGEITKEMFADDYEYSFDGVSWKDCTGTVISLTPGEIGKHLWVRMKETATSFAGNITKVYVPARPRISARVNVRYKNGVYYIDGLSTGEYRYMDSPYRILRASGGTFKAITGQTVEIPSAESDNYFTIYARATDGAFESQPLKVTVERAHNIRINYNSFYGTVTGGGQYFAGEKAVLTAKVNSGYLFKGWYQDGRCVSQNTTYECAIVEDTEFEAKFEPCPPCPHNIKETRNVKAPTCTEAGYTGDVYCRTCNVKVTSGSRVNPLPHTIVTDPAREATCTQNGLTAGSHCGVCRTIIISQTPVPAKGHSYSWIVDKEPTTENVGSKHEECSICHTKRSENTEIPKKVVVYKKGTKLTDRKTKAAYKVTKASGVNGTVEYTKPASKKASSVIIPSTVKVAGVTYKVTTVSASAFSKNTNLKKVTIGKNVTSIGKNAFYQCKKLSSVTISSNVTVIGDKAFYQCTSLKKIAIPSKVSKIGKQTFYGCKNLKSLVIQTSKLTSSRIGSKAFKGIYKKAVIKVPKKKLSAYKKLLKAKGVDSKAKIRK